MTIYVDIFPGCYDTSAQALRILGHFLPVDVAAARTAGRSRLRRESPDRRQAMGSEGRDRVLERYAVGRLVDDVDRLYRELLGTASSETSPR